MKNINRHFSQMRTTLDCKSAYTSEDEKLITSWFKQKRAASQKEYRQKNLTIGPKKAIELFFYLDLCYLV